MPRISTYLLAIILLSSCASKTNSLEVLSMTGSWQLYDVEQLKDDTKSGDAFFRNANLKKMVQEGNIFSLFDDGTYSNIKGDGLFEAGEWKLSDDKKLFYFIDSGRATDPIAFKIEMNINKKQDLALSIPQKNVALKFIKPSDAMKDLTSDPFHRDNNA